MSRWLALVLAGLLAASANAAPPEPLPLPRPVPGTLDLDNTLDLPTGDPPDIKPLPAIPGAPPAGSGSAMPLALGEVLGSVEASFPLLYAIERERDIAGGGLLSAQGAFDLRLNGNDFTRSGSYDNNRVDLGLSQQFAWNGASAYAGYKNGLGTFANYDSKPKTADGGEYRAGFVLPLLRDRAIDARRARVQQAIIGVQQADPVILAQRIVFYRNSAQSYWNWVATGQRVKVARRLRDLADERDQQLADRVRLKTLAQIERVDNQRALAERQARLGVAERRFQQATINLSLYYRDEQGMPVLVDEKRLPEFPEATPIDRNCFPQIVEQALNRRPELVRLRLLTERARVDLQLAENQLLPALNFGVNAAQDVGFAKTNRVLANSPTDLKLIETALTFEVPVQLRDARGRVQTARAQIAQLQAQMRYAQDAIIAEVQDALTALERLSVILEQARLAKDLAKKVEQGENIRFRLGTSNILTITLRELATYDALGGEVDAAGEFFRVLADFQAAIGFGGQR